MAEIYCGNNHNSLELKRGKVIGTRYKCFQKGIGVGKYVLPLDPEYAGDYDPIDTRKIYCGNKSRLPPEYHIMGNNGICFRKGVGVGRSLKAKSKKKSKHKSKKKSKRKSKKKSKRKKTKTKSK